MTSYYVTWRNKNCGRVQEENAHGVLLGRDASQTCEGATITDCFQVSSSVALEIQVQVAPVKCSSCNGRSAGRGLIYT
jgi:hypothetical protein